MSVLTAWGVVSTGDAVVQVARDREVNARRNLTVASYSGLVAPVYYWWWKWLDVRWPGTTFRAVLCKATANQLITTGPNNAAYIAWCTAWSPNPSGLPQPSALERVRTELPSIIASSIGFWMPANMMNFMFVPLHHRILCMSVLNCVWSGWLSNAVNAGRWGDDACEQVVRLARRLSNAA